MYLDDLVKFNQKHPQNMYIHNLLYNKLAILSIIHME